MLTATITGVISGLLQYDEVGRRYCSINSKEAKRSVRVVVRNDKQAAMIAPLVKGDRISVTGPLIASGSISSSGSPVAFLRIEAQHVRIYESGNLVCSTDDIEV